MTVVNVDESRYRLTLWTVNRHIPFSEGKNSEFQDMLSSVNSSIDDYPFRSGNAIRSWVEDDFIEGKRLIQGEVLARARSLSPKARFQFHWTGNEEQWRELMIENVKKVWEQQYKPQSPTQAQQQQPQRQPIMVEQYLRHARGLRQSTMSLIPISMGYRSMSAHHTTAFPGYVAGQTSGLVLLNAPLTF